MSTATKAPAGEMDRVQTSARARAHAAQIVDAPVVVREFRRPASSRLRAASRRRLHAPRIRVAQRRKPRRLGRVVAAVLAIVDIAVMGVLFAAPAFTVHSVSVSGATLLTQKAVLDAAAVPQTSIFSLDGDAIRDRLEALPWIRSATVTTDLPNTVHISIVEWSPVLRLYRAGDETLLADSGAAVPASAARPELARTIPLLVDERPDATQPSADLVRSLDAATASFPAVFGTAVAAYEWRSDNVFVIWTNAGWSVVLGHMDTSADIAQISTQLSALSTLRTSINFRKPAYGYVDLENPASPAVGGHPGVPDAIRAALAAPTTGVLHTKDWETGLRDIPADALPSTSAPTATQPAVDQPAIAAPTLAAAPTAAAVKASPAPVTAPTPTPYTVSYS